MKHYVTPLTTSQMSVLKKKDPYPFTFSVKRGEGYNVYIVFEYDMKHCVPPLTISQKNAFKKKYPCPFTFCKKIKGWGRG